MRIYNAFLLLFFSLFSSCQQENVIEKRNALFYKALSSMTREIKASYGFRIGSTGGGTLGGVNNFSFDVEVPHPISIDETRLLAVSCMEIALRAVNSFAEIRPYLIEYPFPVTGINIGIWIPPHDKMVNSPQTVFFSHGIISYFTKDEKEHLVLLFEESFDEALNKVRKEKIL